MSDERFPKQVLEWTPQGRRKREKPRNDQKDCIDKELREKEIEESLWMDQNIGRL